MALAGYYQAKFTASSECQIIAENLDEDVSNRGLVRMG